MAARSGQIVVANAGAAVPGPEVAGTAWALKAHPTNTKPIWVGNDGADNVSPTTGFPLEPGEGLVVYGASLAQFRFAAEVNGEKCCWVRLY